MQWDYVYADLSLQVTFDAHAHSAFSHLTDTEVKLLQQIVYMAIHTFILTRALNAKDAADFAKRMDECRPKHKQEPDGG